MVTYNNMKQEYIWINGYHYSCASGQSKGCLGKSPTISQQKTWEKRVTGDLRLHSKSCRCVEQSGDSCQELTTGQLQISSQRAQVRVYTIKLESSLVLFFFF